MKLSELIMSVLKLVEQTAFSIPDELTEYKANKDLGAITAMALDEMFGMDELDYMVLTVELEDEYELTMSDSDWPDWYNGNTVTIDMLIEAIVDHGAMEVTD